MQNSSQSDSKLRTNNIFRKYVNQLYVLSHLGGLGACPPEKFGLTSCSLQNPGQEYSDQHHSIPSHMKSDRIVTVQNEKIT